MLAITLRYLASGCSYKDLSSNFRVPHNGMSVFVKETCQAIVDEYVAEVLSLPTLVEE